MLNENIHDPYPYGAHILVEETELLNTNTISNFDKCYEQRYGRSDVKTGNLLFETVTGVNGE